MIPTILLVEDDENDAFIMRRVLQKSGIQAQLKIVSDGIDALNYLRGLGEYSDREKHPDPYLTLLDLNIPYVHGLEVLRQIQHEKPRRIVVVLTSSAAESDIEAAYDYGANSYLLKPSSLDDRRQLVKDLETYWLFRNKWQPTGALST